MNSVRKIIKADNALMRSGPVGITQKIFYAVYIILLIYPICTAFYDPYGERIYFNMYMGAFYCTMMFLYSGFFPMVDNRSSGKGFCYTFIRSAYFMPFKKEDYVKAAFVQWVKIYSVFLIAQIITMIIAMVRESPADKALGGAYFMLNLYHIISGITIFLPLANGYRMSAKNFWWYLNGAVSIAVMIVFFIMEVFFVEEITSALGWYCSPWGIIGGITVIPVVAGITALIFVFGKKHAWFRG